MTASAFFTGTTTARAGLDEAILGGPALSDPNAEGLDPEAEAQRLATLLAHGAHGLLAEGAAAQVRRAASRTQQVLVASGGAA